LVLVTAALIAATGACSSGEGGSASQGGEARQDSNEDGAVDDSTDDDGKIRSFREVPRWRRRY
jgi:hypothetical protein